MSYYWILNSPIQITFSNHLNYTIILRHGWDWGNNWTWLKTWVFGPVSNAVSTHSFQIVTSVFLSNLFQQFPIVTALCLWLVQVHARSQLLLNCFKLPQHFTMSFDGLSQVLNFNSVLSASWQSSICDGISQTFNIPQFSSIVWVLHQLVSLYHRMSTTSFSLSYGFLVLLQRTVFFHNLFKLFKFNCSSCTVVSPHFDSV